FSRIMSIGYTCPWDGFTTDFGLECPAGDGSEMSGFSYRLPPCEDGFRVTLRPYFRMSKSGVRSRARVQVVYTTRSPSVFLVNGSSHQLVQFFVRHPYVAAEPVGFPPRLPLELFRALPVLLQKLR